MKCRRKHGHLYFLFVQSPADTRSSIHLRSSLIGLESDIGLESVIPETMEGGDYVAVRRFELGAAINRLRGLRARPTGTEAQMREGPQKKARIDHQMEGA